MRVRATSWTVKDVCKARCPGRARVTGWGLGKRVRATAYLVDLNL